MSVSDKTQNYFRYRIFRSLPTKHYASKLLLCGLLCLLWHKENFAQKKYTLVIDPGHGGKDPGRLGSLGKQNEKQINLSIALKLGKYIAEKLPQVQLIYTRTDDSFVSLDQIVNTANAAGADFFISIHCNANPDSRIQGTRTHIQSPLFRASQKLALAIEREFASRAKRYSKGIMTAEQRGMNLQVLQYTQMPGVLIEAGFLSHPKEERFLNTDYGQSIIASAIFRAFRSLLSAPIPTENRSVFYKIQIMSSSAPENIHLKKYAPLDMRVEEYKTTNENAYPYRYLVGREYEKRLARKLLKKVQKMGFKDAFIVKMTTQSPLKMIRHNRKTSETMQH